VKRPILSNRELKGNDLQVAACILKYMRIFLRHSFTLLIAGSVCSVGFLGMPHLAAQAPAADSKPQPDVLILVDDEKVVGHFVGSNGASVSFKSDLLGDLTADWSKVKELRVQGQYAVIGKDVKLRPHADTSKIPQGVLEATGQVLTIRPAGGAATQTFAVGDAAQVLDRDTFQKEVEPPRTSPFKAWAGTTTAGGSLVQATQQSRTVSAALNLVRAIPVEFNLPARNRTTFNFAVSDGHILQPNTPTIKTEIVHADAERDEYLKASRVFAFGQLAFDHNFSQGLTLQQNYAGGVGWTVIKQPNQTLDLKGGLGYIHQEFTNASQNQSLVASNFAQAFLHKFQSGISVTEQLTVTPTWNNLSAWLASANAALNIPVYKRFAFTISALDGYLHRPSPGFRKNSFQATMGLTYTLR
jgi:hypothetical protein